MEGDTKVLRDRRETLRRLEEEGIEPYAYTFERTHRAAPATRLFQEAEAADELDEEGRGERVRVAGRLVSYRAHGKSAFANLEDESGEIQVYFRLDVLGDEAFGHLDLLDLGDWVGVEGRLFRTRMGEVTIRVQSWELLAKSLRPLPRGKVEVNEETGERIVHSGFSDTEGRYRQRYADLAVHPEVREIFRIRSRTTRALREFLDDRGFLEVETPVLQPLYGGATARPFSTHHNTLDTELYLRIADELYLKRLIVGGFERVYEIAKDFRNEGIDRFHNPEFTMLEFYQAFADYGDMMDLVEAMMVHTAREVTGGTEVEYQGRTISFEPPYPRIRFMEALEEALGEDPRAVPDEGLRKLAREQGVADTQAMEYLRDLAEFVVVRER